MKLGLIKFEALTLMFADYTNDYDITKMEEYLADDNYGKYLRAMNGSINRCFDRLRSKSKQPKKTLELAYDPETDTDYYLEFDLTEATYEDVDRIYRIVWRGDDGRVIRNFQYEIEGRTLIIENMMQDGKYKLIYLEKLPFITDLTDDEDLVIDESLARLLPYWIKAELYEEDEPSAANQARTIFETYLASLYEEETIVQTKVEDVYE